MGMGKFPPPQLRNRLTDFDEIRNLELSSEDHPPCKISFRFVDVGGLGEYSVCHCLVSVFVLLSFFGLFVTRTGRTGGPILTVYMSYYVFLPKDVPFGGFADIAAHLGGQIDKYPKTPILGA